MSAYVNTPHVIRCQYGSIINQGLVLTYMLACVSSVQQFFPPHMLHMDNKEDTPGLIYDRTERHRVLLLQVKYQSLIASRQASIRSLPCF